MVKSQAPEIGVAGLPMYDLPAVRQWQDAWWTGLADHLRAVGVAGVPSALSRSQSLAELWSHPRLLIAQACGYPLTHGYAGRLRAVATPRYRAPGCSGSDYSSAVVVRADSRIERLSDARGSVCAVNNPDSWSGCHALRAALAPLAGGRCFFREVVVTGGHLASLAAVRAGEVDVCAVDAVTRALLARHNPHHLSGTRVIGYTGPTPGLPYVTRAEVDGDTLTRLRRGLRAASADPELAQVRSELLMDGFEELDDAHYACIPAIIAETNEAGCPELA